MLNFITKENAEEIIKLQRGENIFKNSNVYSMGDCAFVNYQKFINFLNENLKGYYKNLEIDLTEFIDKCGETGSRSFEISSKEISSDIYHCYILDNEIKFIWHKLGEYDYKSLDFTDEFLENEEYDEIFDIVVF